MAGLFRFRCVCSPCLWAPASRQGIALLGRQSSGTTVAAALRSLVSVGLGLMVEITSFGVSPFDFVDGAITAGESINCPSPAAAIERAQALWKVFGHAGSVAFSRTSDFETGKFSDRHVLRRFGQVTDEYR